MNPTTVLDIAVGVVVGLMSVVGIVLLAGWYIRKKLKQYLKELDNVTARR